MQPLSQQAVFIVQSDSFRRFVDHKLNLAKGKTTQASATQYLREVCGITSRKELDSVLAAAIAFHEAVSEYRRWLARENSVAEWRAVYS